MNAFCLIVVEGGGVGAGGICDYGVSGNASLTEDPNAVANQFWKDKSTNEIIRNCVGVD